MSEHNMPEGAAKGKNIAPDAIRALKEAAERRRNAEAEAASSDTAVEINGPKGKEPTRHGDWERKGIAYDF